jgi:PKD repeat protein
MRIQVSTARLQSAGVNASNIQVAHYENDSWHLLNTTVVNQTNETVTIETVTYGFSPFAVTAVGTPIPEVAVTPEPAQPGETLTLDATDSSTPFGEIVSYEWTVAGQERTGAMATVTLDDSGTYTVTLRVTNDAGRTATTTEIITVDSTTSTTGTPTTSTPTTSTTTEPPATDSTTGTDGSGFGVIVALLAVVLAVAVLARRIQ